MKRHQKIKVWTVLAALGLPGPIAWAAEPAKKTEKTEEQRAAESVERALQRHGKDLHRCFERALADTLDVAGKVDVVLELGNGGHVTKVDLKRPGTELPPALVACVADAAKAWTVDGFEPGATVELPFVFEGQMNQFVIKAEDVPERGPAAPKGKGPKSEPMFKVKVLADPVNTRGGQGAVTLLTVGPASRVAMHRHPGSAKALYLLDGHARILGPSGTEPLKLDAGAAVFVPAGYPHVIENMGRTSSAVFLQIFTPAGPEKVYRNPSDPAGRAAFEVIRDPGKLKADANVAPVAVAAAKVDALPLPGGGGHVKILLDGASAQNPALALDFIEFDAGFAAPRHAHKGSCEYLYVVEGGGVLTVGSEPTPFGAGSLLFIPADQPHQAAFTKDGKTVAIQIYMPAGPEQRFRGSTPGSEKPIPTK